MWRFWILVCLFVVVECRGIHEPKKDKVEKSRETDISSGDKKGHKIVEGFDLDNCTDCKRDKSKLTEAGAPSSHINTGSGKPKKHESLPQKTGKDTIVSGSKRGGRKKKGQKKSRNRRHKKNTKHHKGQKSEQLVSDPTDNSSRDRWRNPRLKQLPEVARLEQRLHPTVKNPIHSMMASMDRILQTMRYSVRKVDHDYHYMFNATRYDIMMNVREELMNIAKENDKAYDAVLQASLLTKDIYRRAHRHHLLGPQAIPAAVSSDTMPKLRRIALREHYVRAREELQRAERLKHNIALAERERYGLQTRLMQIQRQVEEKLPARALTDLIRISNQTLRVLQTASLRVDEDGRVYLFGHMHRNSLANLREARDQTVTAKHILSQAKSQIANGRNLRNQIRRRVAERSTDVVADMPFDETRMMLWAVVDSARLHAEKLFMTAADIHMKLTPILKRAKDVLANKVKGSLGRYLEEKNRELRDKMKALDRTLDMIRVVIGNDNILRARCDEILKSSDGWMGTVDQTVIDCDVYITVEGSGFDIDGSGDVSDTEIDVEIPERETPDKKEKASNNVTATATKDNEITINKGKLTEEGISFSKGNITKAGVTRLTDDEDMITKKKIPGTTTVPTLTSTAPLSENVAEEVSEDDDDFTFTDWFGLLSDEPAPGHGHSNNDVNNISLNDLILEKLAMYSKNSRNVFGDTDKTKENLEDLQMRWNETTLTFESFENNVLSTKVFLHGWAAKKLYFDAVHDRVISVKDNIDLQSGLMEQQCSAAVEVADKKLEAAEERREKHSGTAETAADPEDVRVAKQSVAHVKEEVEKILQLKEVHPDPCKSIQNIDTALRTNVSELRKKIEKAKLIASHLQVPLSLKGSGYLTFPLDRDEDTTSSSMSVGMNLKTESSDGPIAVVKSHEAGSLVLSVKDNNPVLTVFDEDEYNIGELTSGIQLDKNSTYRVFAERLGSLFSLFVYSTRNKTLDTNDSMLIESVDPYQLQPSTVYVAGAPDDFPTFGGESWQGCLSQLSVNGRFLSLLQKDSEGSMPEGCVDMRAIQLEENLILGGSGYARIAPEPLSSINRDSMDNLMIQFKAYSDGVLVHIESTSRRAFETVQIKLGRIIVSFKNYNGQTTLISKQDIFRFGVDYDLQIKVKLRKEPHLDVTLNGDSDAFEIEQQPSEIQGIHESALFIGGLPKLQNSSLSGCIRKFMINEQMLTLATVEKSVDVYYGICEQGNCIRFAEGSLPVDLGEAKGRNSLTISFTYGSKGNILEYSKGEKFSITLTLDDEGLDIYESVGEVSERIYLENYAEGASVTVKIKASSDEVEISVGGVTKTVSYESGSVWGGIFANDDDAKYTILVGGSSENDKNFRGKLLDFFMNGRPFDKEKYLETNKLVRCVPPRKKRKLQELEVQESEDVQKFSCE